MEATITAIYENGVLRPLKPLALREHQTVQLQFVSFEDKTEQAIRTLIQAGLLTPPPYRSAIDPISNEERNRLAEIVSAASSRSLAELIIEEQGEL